MILRKIGIGVTLGAALILAASPALAASWTSVPAPPAGQNGLLLGVTSTSDTNAWAVGYWRVQRYQFNPLAIHWNGTAWSTSSSVASAVPGGTILYGVTDISPTDAYAFGNNSSLASGELAQWNGSTWSRVTYPLPTNTGYNTTLNAISADSSSDVWVIGSFLDQVGSSLRWETFSDHWNGSTWTVVPMPLVTGSDTLFTYQISSADAISPTNVWVAGGSGDNASPYGGTPSNTLIEHWNGSAWSVVTSPSPGTNANLTGVTSSSANNVWAVGYDTPSGSSVAQTLTMNWNGTAWTTVASPNQGSSSTVLSSVSTTPGASIVQAVGRSGTSGSLNPFALQNG